LPLEYSSDEDFIYSDSSKLNTKVLEDEQVEVDLFDMRVDENSKLLEMPEERDKEALTSDD